MPRVNPKKTQLGSDRASLAEWPVLLFAPELIIVTIVETPQSRCLVGVARCDITPPVGIYHRMWGAATHERSTGVHRPLTATVLVLAPATANEDSELRVVIAVDHCLLWTAEMNALLDSVSSAAGVDRDALTVFFSHTHGAGLMGLDRRELPGGELIPPYLDELARKIAGLVDEARQRLTPATIVYGTGRCDLAAHRDYFDEARGHFVCGFNPGGPADDALLVGRVTSDSGETLATLVNYACHPTTLAWENTLISPDYIGALREVIESATDAPCVFIQGASGDIGPREGYVGDVSVADRNGRQLGYAALSVLESLPQPGRQFEYTGPVVSGATLGSWKYVPMTASQQEQCGAWVSRRGMVPLRYRADLPVRADLERELASARAAEAKALADGDASRARDARAMVERATRSLTRVALLPRASSPRPHSDGGEGQGEGASSHTKAPLTLSPTVFVALKTGGDEGTGKADTIDAYPFPLVVWRMGAAVWIALDGEHYNVLQRTLRERFPGVTLVIGTLANGSNVWYLPDADSFGKGLYQEEASILAQGSLEKVIEAATAAIRDVIS